MTRAPALPVNDEELADRLTDMLKLLDAVEQPLPKDAALRRLIGEAAEPLSALLGYCGGGVDKDPPTSDAEPELRRPQPFDVEEWS
jgi:hypothetical protein